MSTFFHTFLCSPLKVLFDATESSESNIPSESKGHHDLKKEEGPSSHNNNFDDNDNESIDLLIKLQRLIVQDGRVCTPQDESKVYQLQPYLVTGCLLNIYGKLILLGNSYIRFTSRNHCLPSEMGMFFN